MVVPWPKEQSYDLIAATRPFQSMVLDIFKIIELLKNMNWFIMMIRFGFVLD